MKAENDVKNYLLGISENGGAYFTGSTTKDALSYKTGEEMTFKIRVKCADEYLPVPYIKYTLEGDDGEKSSGIIKAESDGWFYVKASVKSPGFVHLIANACDENQNELECVDAFEGGAGAETDKLVCGTDVPEDYFEFWDWIKAEAYKTEPEIIYKKQFYLNEYPGFVFNDIRIKASCGMYTSCIVSYPENASVGSLKLKMQFQGYGVASVSPEAVDNTMLVSTNAHSIPNMESDNFYEKIRNTELKEYGFDNIQNQNPKTTYWAKMFIRNFQAVRYFKNHPLVNGKDYIFHGGSQGGMQACNMALHSGIATKCELYIPWMVDLGGNAKFSRIPGWRPDYTNGIRYFDTAVAASFMKCPVDITAGLGDYICPPSGQAAMFNGITALKRITYVQNQTHPYRPPEIISYTLGNYSDE